MFTNFRLQKDKNKEPVKNTTEPETLKVEEEWIWVEGYKGTDKNMKCRGYQFEIGEKYIHDGVVEECESGFHLCLKVEDVLGYYVIDFHNRYFKVEALVKKSDYIKYGQRYKFTWGGTRICDKLVAKEIKFIEEISEEEYFKLFKFYDDTHNIYNYIKTIEDYKKCCEMGSYTLYKNEFFIRSLTNTNIYSEVFADWLISKKDANESTYEKALALASENISHDMRLSLLLTDNNNKK